MKYGAVRKFSHITFNDSVNLNHAILVYMTRHLIDRHEN